ncbi:transposase [Streptomyces sp. NPDC005393]|uniref:transposase n=1 Tax=Streptomyces sp. NPDC005393 TaxID=3157041 RepID=UPI0033B3D7B7
MLVRDRLDVLFEDEEFAGLYPSDGRPGFSPGQLARVSVLQFAENLSDRAAADAVRTRIDFKYALGLELEDPGFDYSVLSEFRARLAEGDAADRLLGVMLERLVEAGLLKPGGRQRTDATHVLAAVRTLSRLELAGETVRAALEEVAEADGDWLLPLIEPEWDKRYGRKVEIGKVSGGKAGVTAMAEAFGRDGQKILAAAWALDAPPRLRALPQVEILRQVWVHHYYWDAAGRLRWRDGRALPPASLRFDSPYDTDAHYCVKRDTAWSGYGAHLTETCDTDRPEVVVHVATTIAPVQDGELTERIHDDLAGARLAPAEHVVDAAYVTAARIERARRVHGVTLLGPVVPDHSRQARSGDGFDKSAFSVDWDNQQATCPQGAVRREWGSLRISGHHYIQKPYLNRSWNGRVEQVSRRGDLPVVRA